MRSILLTLVYPLLATVVWATPAELRDPDVLYLDQNLPEKIVLTLEKPASVYLDKDFQTLGAALPIGTKVQIVGLGNDGNYLVSTKYRGTRLEGWAAAADLPPVDPKLLDAARQSQARRDAIEKAIKEKRVIQGMTLDEVKRALGKPERTSFRQDAQVRFDTWTYITYELVPQNTFVTDALGRTYAQTVYVKSPIGELSVDFNNGSVVSVEEHRRAGRNTPGLTVPAPPVTDETK